MNFFVCQVRGVNTPGFPLFCCFPSNLQTHHKGASVPFLNRISHSDVLPAWVLFLTSIWFFPFLYGLLSLFLLGFLTFFYFWIVSFCESLCASLLFHFAPCLLGTWYYSSSFVSIYFSPPSSYFLSLVPYFLSLILLFPSRWPLTKHPLPTLCLKPLKKCSRLEWNRQRRVEWV